MDRKLLKEQFVTGFAGGSIWEVYGLTGVCWLSMLVHEFVSRCVPRGASSLLADFIFNWAVVLAATTVYANKLGVLASILAIVGFVAFCSAPKATSRQPEKQKQHKGKPERASAPAAAYRQFLTIYRSAMMVLTVTAILAVDFPLFPRRFAKTETWGTSLMDLGVGSFVFSMGIISARTRLKAPSIGFFRELKSSLIQTSKVLALGLVRLASVKMLDYQEHVSEYGVHWNFFFTLGLLPFAFTLTNRIPFIGGTFAKSFFLSIGYELVLKNGGLQEWALAAPRVSLISQNKEGLASFAGYLAIFHFGFSLGREILSPQTSLKKIVIKTSTWAVIGQATYSLLIVATEPSRRIANLPYIAWVVAFNAGFIALLAASELWLGLRPSPSYVSANTFGETIFIFANLATGIVNLSMDTLSMHSVMALGVLLGYQFLVMGLANYLYSRR